MAENLVLRLIARTSAFDRGMRKSRSGVKGMRTSVAGLSRTMRGLATRALAVAGVGGLGFMIKRTLDSVDANAKLSDRIGITTEKLVGLQHAAKINGVEQETLNKSLEIFNRRLGEVKLGTGEAERALDALGLSADQLANQTPAEAIGIIADQINKLETQSEKGAAANFLFGRSGMQLLNLFSKGSEGIAAYQAEVEKLGMTYSRVDAAQIEAANDALARTKGAIGGVVTNLTVQLAPLIEIVADELTEMATGGTDFGDAILNASETAVMGLTKVARAMDRIITAAPRMKSDATLALLMGSRNVVQSRLEKAQSSARTRLLKGGRAEARRDVEIQTRELARFDAKIAAESDRFQDPSAAAAAEDRRISAWYNAVRKRSRKAAEEAANSAPGAPLADRLPGLGTDGASAASSATFNTEAALGRMASQMKRVTANNAAAQRKILDDQADIYREHINDKVLIDQWYSEQVEQLDIKRLQASNNLLSGFKAASMQMQRETRTWGEIGFETAMTMEQGFATAFESIATRSQTAGDAMKTMLRGVALEFQRLAVIQPAAKLLSGALAAGIGGLFVSSAGTSTAGAGGGSAINSPGGNLLVGHARGGISNRPAIFGEGGPEAAVPLPDGRSIPVTLRGQGGGIHSLVISNRNEGDPINFDVEKMIAENGILTIDTFTTRMREGGELTRSVQDAVTE